MDCESERSHRFRSRGRNTMTEHHSVHHSIYGHYPNDVNNNSGNTVHHNLSEKAIRVPESKTTVLELLTALTFIQRLASAMTTMTKIMKVRKKRLSRFGIRRGFQYQDRSFSELDPLEEFVCGEWTWRPPAQYTFT